MLISSVAMLLVAMMALGSATFAWFSTNTKATASGLTAKTTQASNILLSESGTDGWKDKLIFAKSTATRTDTLTPVTPGTNFDNWKTTTADGVDTGIPSVSSLDKYDTATEGTDYLATELYVKYEAPTTDSKNVDIKVNIEDKSENSGSTQDFIRVALVPIAVAEGGTTTGSLASAAIVYGNAKDDFAKDPTAFTTLTADDTKSMVTVTTTTLLSNVALSGAKVYGFKVYVWYEGTDINCIDSNSNNNFAVSFEVSQHK
jgi:hypothetical protein